MDNIFIFLFVIFCGVLLTLGIEVIYGLCAGERRIFDFAKPTPKKKRRDTWEDLNKANLWWGILPTFTKSQALENAYHITYSFSETFTQEEIDKYYDDMWENTSNSEKMFIWRVNGGK